MQISCQTTGNQSIFFFIFVHSNFNIYFRISIIEKSISGKGWFINMNHYSWEIFHSIFPRIMVKYSITIDIHLSPMKTDATHGNIFLASDLHQKWICLNAPGGRHPPPATRPPSFPPSRLAPGDGFTDWQASGWRHDQSQRPAAAPPNSKFPCAPSFDEAIIRRAILGISFSVWLVVVNYSSSSSSSSNYLIDWLISILILEIVKSRWLLSASWADVPQQHNDRIKPLTKGGKKERRKKRRKKSADLFRPIRIYPEGL